jgi:hypothetical protein
LARLALLELRVTQVQQALKVPLVRLDHKENKVRLGLQAHRASRGLWDRLAPKAFRAFRALKVT